MQSKNCFNKSAFSCTISTNHRENHTFLNIEREPRKQGAVRIAQTQRIDIGKNTHQRILKIKVQSATDDPIAAPTNTKGLNSVMQNLCLRALSFSEEAFIKLVCAWSVTRSFIICLFCQGGYVQIRMILISSDPLRHFAQMNFRPNGRSPDLRRLSVCAFPS